MLKIKDLMTAAPEVVSPDADMHTVLEQMNRSGLRHLPVVLDDDLVGIITDRDVRLAVNSPVVSSDASACREAVLDDIRVGECMTPEPQCVSPAAPAHEVADLLSLNKFGAMPVVDEGVLVGVISYVDYLKHYAAQR